MVCGAELLIDAHGCAPRSLWCIVRTLEAAGFVARPYQTGMTSFGVWGFALAIRAPFEPPQAMPADLQAQLKYLNADALSALFRWPADLAPPTVEINRLDNQMLVRYYEMEWQRLN
jgi:spermidine synthase